MKLEPALARWTEEGLIDQATADAISAFETGQNRIHPVLMTLGGLGGFAVFLGAMALVGANWASIPAAVKLVGTILLGGGLAFGLWRAEAKAPLWVAELLRLLYVGWVLGAIAIIGQVFQLDGSASGAITWWVVFAGFVWSFTRSRLVSLGFLAMLFVVCFTAQDVLFGQIAEPSLFWIPIVFPAVTIGLLNLPAIRRRRPELAATGRWSMGAVLVGVASVSSVLVAHDLKVELPRGVLMAVVIGGLVSAGLVSQWKPRPKRWTVVAMATVYVMAAMPVLAGAGLGGGDIVSSGLFFVLMGVIAAGAHEARNQLLWRLATFFIAMRLLVLYGFYASNLGNLGVSLLGGGILMLMLTFAWYRSGQLLRETP